MRRLLSLLALLGAGCSVTHEKCDCRQDDRGAFGYAAAIDTDEDGLPDARIFDNREFGSRKAVFVDTDDDGLPDTRSVSRNIRVRDDDRLEDALEGLERAIAEVRAAMRRR